MHVLPEILILTLLFSMLLGLTARNYKNKGIKIGYYLAKVDYGWRYITPSIEYRHKYLDYWEISLSWWKWSVVIDFCRKD